MPLGNLRYRQTEAFWPGWRRSPLPRLADPERQHVSLSSRQHHLVLRGRISKGQGRAKRRRKGGPLKDYRCYQGEVEKTRKLLSVLSPQGRHHDTIYFRQLLCPDPSCEVCNGTTAEINRLLFPEALEDATPLASIAPVTDSSSTLSPAFSAVPPGDLISASLSEPSPPPASNFSPNPVAPLTDLFPPSPPGDSLPPEHFPPLHSKFPMDHFSPQPLAFPPVPPHDAQTVDSLVQPEANLSLNTIFNPLPEHSQTTNPTDSSACPQASPTLSVSPPDRSITATQSKSFSITVKPVPESSSADSPGGLSTYVTTNTGIDHSSLSISDSPRWQTHARDFFPSTLAPCHFPQEFLALHSSEASSRGDPAANFTEPGNLSLLSPDILALLEKQVQKKSDLLMWKDMKGGSSLPKNLKPDYPPNSLGKMLGSIAYKPDLSDLLPIWSSKDQSKEMPVHQQPPYSTNLEEGHLQQTSIQLFWGLPTLHSESLSSAARDSDDCSSIFIFSRISNTSTGQESPVVPHPSPLPLPENQSQPIPQIQPQIHLKSPLPILPSGPLPQIKICGVCFHRPQHKSEPLLSSEMQRLEWNVLQKQQESVWGLPPVVQRSNKDFCPSAPDRSIKRPAFQARVAISILPGQFPLSEELRKELEHHLRKRLIQHRWGLPRRIYESVSLMMPPSDSSETPKCQRFRGRTWISKSHSNLSESESYEQDSELLQLRNIDMGKDQGHNPGSGPKDHLLSQNSSDNDLGYDSEKEFRSPSEKNPMSLDTAGQRQLENVLKIHLSKKFEEINEGRLPGTVHNSWHTMKQMLLLSKKSHTEIKQRSLPPSVGEDYTLNTFQELSFVESSAQEMLEAHIRRFCMRMIWGLPPRVLESIQLFKLREASTHSSFCSSTNLISEVNSKSLLGDKAAIANSGPILDRPLPATSTMGEGEQRIPRGSPSHINHELAEDVQRIKEGRQTFLPIRHDTTGRASQRQTLPANRWPPTQTAREAGAGHEPKDKRAYSSGRVEMQQGRKIPVIMPTVSREIFRAKELDARQSRSNDTLTTSKLHVNQNKIRSTVPIQSPSQNISILQDPKSSKLKEQLLSELKLKLENREYSRVHGQCTGLPAASNSLTYKVSLTHAHSIISGGIGASQVLRVHPEDTKVSMEQQQDPWVSKHVLREHQNKNPPPAAVTVSPLGSKAEELGGWDAEFGTSQLRKKSFPREDVALKKSFPTQDVGWKKHESKPSQTLSQKGQPRPESLFREKMNPFLQWLNPGIKCKRQNSQVKGTPQSSVESRGLVKGRTAFTGMTKDQKIMTDGGKVLEEEMGCRHAIDITCPQQPLPSPTKLGKTQPKAQVQAQAQSVQGHPFNHRTPSCKETDTKSCHQEAVFGGQGHFRSIGQIREKERCPHKAVAFKDQLLCQKYPLSMPHREPVSHPTPTSRHPGGQGPPANLLAAKSSVFRGLSLLFRHKTFLQNLQGGKTSHPQTIPYEY
ncbi:spermatogenesis-associated protein 31D4-like isoform X8 [Canis lupus familiaris]|uniref:spermatogenesis-associated protein 31D4-like isoform X8 n=1 Tax=Canis lupus familiaris TaxID=9615 RepID=UPI0018F52CFA|nr:spermatogenesis-associated protein 31D4-like isoform X8 [Canis lupus familiaris]